MTPADRLAHTSRWRHRSLTEKAALSLGLLALALTLPPWPGGAAVLAAGSALALLGARVPPGAWVALAAPPLGFALVGAAGLAVELGPDGLAPARDGGRAALELLLRASAALSALLLLAVTTPATDLVRGLRRLGLSAELADLALAVYRFIFVLADTAQAMHAAQAARLGHAGWVRQARALGLLAASLLPRALDRARRMEVGLAARGYDGSLPSLAAERPVSAGGLATVAGVLAAVAMVGLWPL